MLLNVISLISLLFILCSKVTVSLRYADLVSVLPSRIRVLAWPVHPSKKILVGDRKGSGAALAQSIPSRLSYAEDALRTMSLPEGLLYFNSLFFFKQA